MSESFGAPGSKNFNPSIFAKSKALLINKIDLLGHVDFDIEHAKKDASPYEFDLVINSDFIAEPSGAAEVIACAFKEKFSRK